MSTEQSDARMVADMLGHLDPLRLHTGPRWHPPAIQNGPHPSRHLDTATGTTPTQTGPAT